MLEAEEQQGGNQKHVKDSEYNRKKQNASDDLQSMKDNQFIFWAYKFSEINSHVLVVSE